MSSTEEYVDEVLEELDEIGSRVQNRKKLLDEFLEVLQENIKNQSLCNLLERIHFRHPSSSYEHVVVDEKTDFDIAMVLPRPYIGENFEVVKTHHGPGLYKLKWIHDEKIDDKLELIDKNGFLKSIELRDNIFNQLTLIINKIKRDRQEWQIRNTNHKASICVYINELNEDFDIKIDLVPQMQVSNWERTPDPPSDSELPSILREYVHQTKHPMFFSFASPAKSQKSVDSYAAPYRLNKEHDKHLYVTCSFSELEKHCLRSRSDDTEAVRNAVRLVKLVSLKYDWKKKFSLHSFHIKRVAVKHFDALERLSNWAAFQKLLSDLADNLEDGHIDGFFIRNQDVYNQDDGTCHDFAETICEVKRSLNPNNLRKLLTVE